MHPVSILPGLKKACVIKYCNIPVPLQHNMYKRHLQNSGYQRVIFSASESFLANLLLYFVMGTLCGLVFNWASV